MGKAHTTWTVLAHGPLEQLDDGLWRLEGSVPKMPLRRVMAVVRRRDGGLIVHNPIALDEAGMAALEGLGPVAVIAVPNGWHRLDAARFHARYPSAEVVAPPASRRKVAEVVPVSGRWDATAAAGDDDVRFELVDGTAGLEGALIVRRPAGTSVVLTDAVFNMPHLPGPKGLVLRYVTGSSGGPRVSRIARLLLIKDRAAFRRYLERLADLPGLRRVLVAHHETIDRDPAATLRAVAATL